MLLKAEVPLIFYKSIFKNYIIEILKYHQYWNSALKTDSIIVKGKHAIPKQNVPAEMILYIFSNPVC